VLAVPGSFYIEGRRLAGMRGSMHAFGLCFLVLKAALDIKDKAIRAAPAALVEDGGLAVIGQAVVVGGAEESCRGAVAFTIEGEGIVEDSALPSGELVVRLPDFEDTGRAGKVSCHDA